MLPVRHVTRIALAGIVFLPAAGCAQQAASARDSSAAVREFVQGFLDWYTPIALSDTGRGPRWWSVQSQADRYLDRDLATALRGDSIAQEDGPMNETRETLNFDPFLASQDPCGPYEAIEVTRGSGVFKVSIRQCRAQRAGMIIEVRAVEGRFRISNVIYGSGRDLKYWLCKWAKADRRPERRPASC